MATAQLTIDVRLTPAQRRASLVAEAVAGLTARAKVISPVWFYDERGSVLFEQITRLPEYYLTRAEHALLLARSKEIAALTRPQVLAELGSGTSDKTRLLLDAMLAERTLSTFAPLDVSEETLRDSAIRLASEYPSLSVHGVVGDFVTDLDALPRRERRVVAFLGSTIGNLAPAERRDFLSSLRAQLERQDFLLLGADLVKDERRLWRAYNDSAGVTAAFNRNALRVLNRELGADFDEQLFAHVARWNRRHRRVEMYLRSLRRQRVCLRAVGVEVTFARGELLRTEISTKFTPGGLRRELAAAGLDVVREWPSAEGYLLLLAAPGEVARQVL